MSEYEWPNITELRNWVIENKTDAPFVRAAENGPRQYRPGLDCVWCGRVIRTQAFRGTDHCCDEHRKMLHGNDKSALTGMHDEVPMVKLPKAVVDAIQDAQIKRSVRPTQTRINNVLKAVDRMLEVYDG